MLPGHHAVTLRYTSLPDPNIRLTWHT